jgi:hypothetical protein
MCRCWLISCMCAMGLMCGGAPATAIPLPGGGIVLYVDDDAPPGGDGMSWTTAFRFLQDALDFAAQPGQEVNEIRVAQGVYRPDRDESAPDGTGDRRATFSLADGAAVMGGYAGLGAENPDERDVELYETVLSGDLAGDDEPGLVNNDENSHHVVSIEDGREAVIDGCIITAGNADGDEGDDMFGGGIYNRAQVTIIACRVADNAAALFGALFSPSDQVLAMACTFIGNEGGAVHAAGGGVFTDCLFIGNHGQAGGALGGAATLFGCTFIGNTAAAQGGAVDGAFDTHIFDCVFIANAAGAWGGALCVSGGLLTLDNCVFEQNSAQEDGGAIWLGDLPTPDDLIINCSFIGNQAANRGGALFHGGTPLGGPQLMHCTFADNTAHLGGGVYVPAISMEPADCTFIANAAYHGGGLYLQGHSPDEPTLMGLTFLGNEAAGGGGAYLDDAAVTFADCLFDGNAAVRGGGMFSDESAMTALRCTFDQNTAVLNGGGMRSEDSTVTVADCTFTGNGANHGGAMDNDRTVASITGSIFAGNVADLRGGGLRNGSGCATIVDDCEFTDNHAEQGGGISDVNWPITLTLGDSYLCDNTPDHVDGWWVDEGGNHFCALSEGDIDGDGVIGTADLILLLAAWGDCPPPPDDCPADLNGDRHVNTFDLLTLLANWG